MLQLFVFVLSFLTLILAQSCPSGYAYYSSTNKCYKYVSKEESFKDADKSCATLIGGHLVSIHNAFENTFVHNNVSGAEHFWIGLSFNYPQLDLNWEDVSMVNYTNWGFAQPASPSATSCVWMRKGDLTWATDLCHKKKHYLCEASVIA